jgi:hypothetical protein
LSPSLQWIFALFEWLAKNWPNLENQPNILEGTPIIKKLKESVNEIAQFAVHFREFIQDKEEKGGKIQEEGKIVDDKEEKERERKYCARHILNLRKYPNTKEMTFFGILENILNKVIN